MAKRTLDKKDKKHGPHGRALGLTTTRETEWIRVQNKLVLLGARVAHTCLLPPNRLALALTSNVTYPKIMSSPQLFEVVL
jgi:hypothetical protein